MRLFLERIGTRFVRRFDPSAAIADLREAVMDAGTTQPLFIFPEGTFKRMPGLLPFHLGAFAVAKETGAAIVPVAIRIDLDGRIVIDFHEPLPIDEPRETLEMTTRRIIEGYVRLLEETIRTYPWSFDPARIDLFWRRTGVEEGEPHPRRAS